MIEELSEGKYGLPEDVGQRVKKMLSQPKERVKIAKEKEQQTKDSKTSTVKPKNGSVFKKACKSTSALQKLIEQALQEYYLLSDTVSIEEKDEQYQEGFRGESKAKDVIKYIDKQKYLALDRMAYVSIGGGDGSEVAFVMHNKNIRYGLIVEPSDYGTEEARRRKEALKAKGKELIVLQGDAMQRLGDCSKKLREWKQRGYIDGVILSIQAVLHELPSRSLQYDPNVLLARIFEPFDLRMFYCREPASPRGWPSIVHVRLEKIPGHVLFGIAKQVRDVLGFSGKVENLTDGYVQMPADLAVETLFKVLYFNDINRHRYEMEECLTAFDPEKFSRILNNYLKPQENLEVQHMVTDTFRSLYKQYGVHARSETGEEFGIPKPFVTITGFQDKRK